MKRTCKCNHMDRFEYDEQIALIDMIVSNFSNAII